jgi:bis(5'-nucleosidyl)-tetraphosphatase
MLRAAGILLYRCQASQSVATEGVEFLLLKASYPPFHWSPPKGHIDANGA